jgi:hypothetical protein
VLGELAEADGLGRGVERAKVARSLGAAPDRGRSLREERMGIKRSGSYRWRTMGSACIVTGVSLGATTLLPDDAYA